MVLTIYIFLHKILSGKFVAVNIYIIIYKKFELWYWDHINGSSLIFVNEDIEKFTEDELYEICSLYSPGFNKKGSTLKKGNKYCFVNYGFSYD